MLVAYYKKSSNYDLLSLHLSDGCGRVQEIEKGMLKCGQTQLIKKL
jgi:hypothetical protein